MSALDIFSLSNPVLWQIINMYLIFYFNSLLSTLFLSNIFGSGSSMSTTHRDILGVIDKRLQAHNKQLIMVKLNESILKNSKAKMVT